MDPLLATVAKAARQLAECVRLASCQGKTLADNEVYESYLNLCASIPPKYETAPGVNIFYLSSEKDMQRLENKAQLYAMDLIVNAIAVELGGEVDKNTGQFHLTGQGRQPPPLSSFPWLPDALEKLASKLEHPWRVPSE